MLVFVLFLLKMLFILIFIVRLFLKSSKGFCVSSKGVDQNNGVIKIGSKDFGPGIDLQTSCFKLCVEYSKESDDVMTGCEAIFNQANCGCYFHTDIVEKANGVKNHACWIV